MSFNIFPVTKEYQEFSFHTLFKVLDACVLSLYLLFPTSTSSTSWKRKDRSQRTIKRSENGRKVKLQSTKKFSLPRNSFFPSNSANHKSIRKGVTVTTQTTVSADCLPLKCRPSVSRGGIRAQTGYIYQGFDGTPDEVVTIYWLNGVS